MSDNHNATAFERLTMELRRDAAYSERVGGSTVGFTVTVGRARELADLIENSQEAIAGAARYRWLREDYNRAVEVVMAWSEDYDGEASGLDETIDALMRTKAESTN